MLDVSTWDNTTWLLLVLLAALLLAFLIAGTVSWWQEFSHQLRTINREIRRSQGEQQKRWKRRKRRLLLSLIPFVRYR